LESELVAVGFRRESGEFWKGPISIGSLRSFEWVQLLLGLTFDTLVLAIGDVEEELDGDKRPNIVLVRTSHDQRGFKASWDPKECTAFF